MGRPTKYQPEYAEQARKLALLGLTNVEMAEFFEVATSTFNLWLVEHQDFSDSVKGGKVVADAEVSASLFKRATGYQKEAVKIFNDQGSPMVVPYVENVAPDTAAAFIWLKNRQPHLWRQKTEVDHTTGGEKIPSGLGAFYGGTEE